MCQRIRQVVKRGPLRRRRGLVAYVGRRGKTWEDEGGGGCVADHVRHPECGPARCEEALGREDRGCENGVQNGVDEIVGRS